jgi:hypothetical protein
VLDALRGHVAVIAKRAPVCTRPELRRQTAEVSDD